MKKYRWHKLHANIDINKLIEALEDKTYSEQIGEGFRLDSVRKKIISGSYIERIEYKEECTRPDGTAFEQMYLTYHHTKFEIDFKNDLIEVQLPSKRLGVLLTKLNEISKFKLVIEDVTVDPLLWLEHLEKRNGQKLILGQILFVSILLKDNIVGDIKLCREDDIRSNLDVISGLRKCVPRKIYVRSDKNTTRTSFVLTNNAIVEYGDALGSEARLNFKETLVELLQ